MKNNYIEFLGSIKNQPQGKFGRNIQVFGRQVQSIETISDDLNKKLNRYELMHLCSDFERSDLSVVVAVLGWGGMRFDHARRLFENWEELAPLIKLIRTSNSLNRKEVFQSFSVLRKQNKIPGLGIGYYTKLICFLNPSSQGYILDQWTAKSINLLYETKIVDINNAGWVTDKNDSNTYEEFCLKVEELARYWKIEPLEAELKMFSNGGRKKGRWREYLIKEYDRLESKPLRDSKKSSELVIFSHGKESGPDGAKINAMRAVAEELGFKTVSIDYTACQDEIERKALLRNYLSNQSEKVILVGSSMGGYVSAALANEFELNALFLLCPALSLEGYEPVDYKPRTDKIVLVHGWSDDIVPVQSSIDFARKHKATLHIVEDGHRLTPSIPHITRWFNDMLSEVKKNE